MRRNDAGAFEFDGYDTVKAASELTYDILEEYDVTDKRHGGEIWIKDGNETIMSLEDFAQEFFGKAVEKVNKDIKAFEKPEDEVIGKKAGRQRRNDHGEKTSGIYEGSV
jgi:hypothetical protein